MNTRLQVEHPVTELVTGLDLVRHQILIAAGSPLTLNQATIAPRGHAIEVRIYAEDATQNFLPSTGSITVIAQPEGPGIRLDSGVEQGDEITQYYDPMIAKLIVYGEDRSAAIERLHQALASSAFFGVTTNIPLLTTICQHPAFQQGQTYTDFLETHGLLDSAQQNCQVLPDLVLAGAALYEMHQESTTATMPNPAWHGHAQSNLWQQLGPWRIMGGYRKTYHYQEQAHTILLQPYEHENNVWNVHINNQPTRIFSYLAGNNHQFILQENHEQTCMHIWRNAGEIQIAIQGSIYHLHRAQPPEITNATHAHGGNQAQKTLKTPMAGTIVRVQAHDGDIVEAHQTLLILSAMKMEHAITAPYTGKIQHIYYQEGAVVAGGTVVVEME
jgi:3-methylcrotonyl-CoA carboxylase alpha subunit